MKRFGWSVLVFGFLCVLAGILAKRVFDVRQYLIWFHIVGGLCIIGGGMLIFGDRAEKQ